VGKYAAYPAYKDSRVEWLGNIPEHWDSVALRWISKRYSGGTPDKKNDDYWYEGTIPWLNSGAVNQQVITKPSTYITIEAFKNSSAKWVPKDAVLIALAGQGKTKGMAAFTTFPTTCNQSMAAVIFEGYDAKFMFWWLTSQYKNIRGLASDDARDGLNLEMIGSIPCPILDKSEQQQIARFLDEKTAHLDKLIGQKQQMIVLLNEKRMALITQAVTKGLDLTVPMKDSGVEWLGDIPEHWDSVALRWISKRYSGGTPNKKNDDYWYEGTIPWLNSGAVNQQVITKPSAYITIEAFKNSSAKWILENAVLIALAGQGKTKGMAAYTTFSTTCNQSMAAVVFEEYNPKFMFWWLTSQYKNIRGLASDDARDGLNLEMIGSIPCPIFDTNEQQQIANFLDTETQKIDDMIKTVKQAIATLQEYRTALITAAVTGKIDVRGFKLST